jgi:hypothetical protein
MYNVILRRVRSTIVAVGKSNKYTYSECVFVALGTQHEMSKRHIFICDLSGTAVFFYLIS